MAKPKLSDLRKRAKAAAAAADKAHSDSMSSKEDARALAVEAADAYRELDREEWAQAQESLGVAREDLDLDNFIVTTMPIGPKHDVLTNGAVADG